MTQPRASFKDSKQRGNATIYVLLVVALFAALTFVLSRQSDDSEGSHLSKDKAAIIAAQLMAYPLQVRQSLDMMTMTGESVSDLEFMLPGETGYDSTSGSPAPRIFHPSGGGLILATLPSEATEDGLNDPDPGWYLDRFNTTEWTPTDTTDVMLVAWGLTEPVCKAINERITGSDAIPATTDAIPDLFISDSRHSGTNQPLFSSSECLACFEMPALCVQNNNRYGFYSLIIGR